jgi:hypothetical protein
MRRIYFSDNWLGDHAVAMRRHVGVDANTFCGAIYQFDLKAKDFV